jgi:hypothetical protein
VYIHRLYRYRRLSVLMASAGPERGDRYMMQEH